MVVCLFRNLLSTDAHCLIIILSVHDIVVFRKAASRGLSALILVGIEAISAYLTRCFKEICISLKLRVPHSGSLRDGTLAYHTTSIVVCHTVGVTQRLAQVSWRSHSILSLYSVLFLCSPVLLFRRKHERRGR